MARETKAYAFGRRRVVWPFVAPRDWQSLMQRVISSLDFSLLAGGRSAMTSSIVRGMRIAFVEVPGVGYELARRFPGVGSTRISPLFLKVTVDFLDLDRSSILADNLLEGAAFG